MQHVLHMTCDDDVYRPHGQCSLSVSELKSLQSRWTRQQGSSPVSLLCWVVRSQVRY